MTQCHACAEEPTLRDMLDDSILRGVMARDGVKLVDVEELMANYGSRRVIPNSRRLPGLAHVHTHMI